MKHRRKGDKVRGAICRNPFSNDPCPQQAAMIAPGAHWVWSGTAGSCRSRPPGGPCRPRRPGRWRAPAPPRRRRCPSTPQSSHQPRICSTRVRGHAAATCRVKPSTRLSASANWLCRRTQTSSRGAGVGTTCQSYARETVLHATGPPGRPQPPAQPRAPEPQPRAGVRGERGAVGCGTRRWPMRVHRGHAGSPSRMRPAVDGTRVPRAFGERSGILHQPRPLDGGTPMRLLVHASRPFRRRGQPPPLGQHCQRERVVVIQLGAVPPQAGPQVP